MILTTILLATVLCSEFDSSVWLQQSTARAGDPIIIVWEYDDANSAQITGWNLYRQTGIFTTETKIATGGPATRRFDTVMPSGRTERYRFIVRPMLGLDIGPGGVEVLVKRVK